MKNKIIVTYFLPSEIITIRDIKNKIKIKKSKQQTKVILTN